MNIRPTTTPTTTATASNHSNQEEENKQRERERERVKLRRRGVDRLVGKSRKITTNKYNYPTSQKDFTNTPHMYDEKKLT